MQITTWNQETQAWEATLVNQLIVPALVGKEYRPALFDPVLAAIAAAGGGGKTGGGGGGGGSTKIRVLNEGAFVVTARKLNFGSDFLVTDVNGDQADISQTEEARTKYVSGYYVDCTALGGNNEIQVPVPVTGTLVSVRISTNFSPDANMPFQCNIAGVAVTNGLVTVPNGALAGTVYSASPTGNNACVAGTDTVQVILSLANNALGQAFLTFGFLPA